MSVVRPANFVDIPALLDLARSAHAASRYSVFSRLGEQQAKSVFVACLGAQHAQAAPNRTMNLVSDGTDGLEGALIGVMRPLYEVLDVQMATDVFWYCRPDANPRTGLRLLRGFHEWAETWPGSVVIRHGVHDAIGDPVRTGRAFEASGFRAAGAIYEKEIRK